MIRRERRDAGEGEERGLRKGAEREDRDREKRDKRELSEQFEDEVKEHRHLPLLVVQLPQGTAFLLSSRLSKALQ